MSRAMLVTVLWRVENKPAVNIESGIQNLQLSDVVKGSWYYDAVIWAVENKIVEGYGNGKLGPNDPVTREQAVAIIYRYAKSKGQEISAVADLSGFIDETAISDYALNAMKWAVDLRIILGLPGDKIAPKISSTRAELATIIRRFYTTI